MANIEVRWTGEYPCLCSGKWELSIDGVDYSHTIPFTGEAGTFGTYRGYFDDDYIEHFYKYESGMDEEEWIEFHKAWIETLPCDPSELFRAFQSADWRHGSCGGCI